MGGDSSRAAGETTSPSSLQMQDRHTTRSARIRDSHTHSPHNPTFCSHDATQAATTKKRDSFPTCLLVGTGSYAGGAATSPYGGTCRHQEEARYELALHLRPRRHNHGCHKKIRSWRMDYHRGHQSPLFKRQSCGDSIRATTKSESQSRHPGGASLELHRAGLPCVHTHRTHRRNLTRRHPPQGLHRLTDV